MRSLWSLYAAFACTLCLGVSRIEAAAPAFIPIDAYEISAVSADGSVAAGEHLETPYLWTEAGGVQLIPLPAETSMFSVTGLSADGTTIVGGVRVGRGFDSFYESFRWRSDVGYQRLGRFPESDWLDWAYATDVSFDGSVVVGTNDTENGRRAFRWSESAGMINLGHLGSTNPIYPPYSDGLAISEDGEIIVGQATTLADYSGKAFRWTPAGGYDVIGLPAPLNGGLANGGAQAISGNGQVLAGFSQNIPSWSWVWTESTGFASLNPRPGNRSSSVASASFDGSLIVGNELTWNNVGAEPTAAIWHKEGDRYKIYLVADLLQSAGVDLGGWHLRDVVDVSHDGRTIVGHGVDPAGMRRSYMARLPVLIPEPSALIIGGLASIGLPLAIRRRRARIR